MKISLNWLKDYVKIRVDANTLAGCLTMAGLEVESIGKAGATDTVFEIEVTPNRADCLSVIGVAREVAAVTKEALKRPAVKKIAYPKKAVPVEIRDKDLCRRYIGTLIQGVRIKPAPAPVKKRLGALGMRPVNNIVDITNFSLWENGQPLHAFDYDKLEGGRIVVRRAAPGETLEAIDGNTYPLDPSVLVIADAVKPVAIAGIMGGRATEVTAATKNILLESACFDPVTVRRASRKLALSTDSSYRFERGVDMEGVLGGCRRAQDMILDHAGGVITAYTDRFAGKPAVRPPSIRFTVDSVNRRLGAGLTAAHCRTVLRRLEFKVKPGPSGALVAEAPGFRGDIHETVDIIEEIARVTGYDNLPSKIAAINAVNIPECGRWQDKKDLRRAFTALGCDEIVTHSLTSSGHLKRCRRENDPVVKIRNPLSADYDTLRPAFLPAHLPVVLNNVNRGLKNLRFFEIGKIYSPGSERDALGLVLAGKPRYDWRLPENPDADFFDLKGIVEQSFACLGVTGARFVPVRRDFFAEGQAAEVQFNGRPAGLLGRIEDGVLREWNFKGPVVYAAEIMLDPVFQQRAREESFEPPSEYPAMVRDLSLAVRKGVLFDEVRALAQSRGGEFLTGVELVEEYLGDKVPPDTRGIVFSLRFQSARRTLTDEEVAQSVELIRQALVGELGAISR
jgi:phenylalanyl-tRNA synthetase beta chain